jgi:uncharacterized protein
MKRPPPIASEGAAEAPLHGAAWSGDLREVKRLISAGADVNWRDSVGETALFGACAWGHQDVVRFLLSAGANHTLAEFGRGLTSLHWAASHGNIETIRTLVEAGADPTTPDRFGELPIDSAHKSGKGSHVAYLKTVGPDIASRRERTERSGR